MNGLCGALDLGLAGALPVEVEARRGRPRGALPGARRDAREGQARRAHQRLLAAGHDDVEAPCVGLERRRAEARDRRRPRAARRGRACARRSPAMSAVAPVEVSLCTTTASGQRGRASMAATTWSTSGRSPSSNAQRHDLGPVGLGHRDPAIAEVAGRHAQHAIAGREQVRVGGLERAGARRGEHEHVVRGAVDGLQLLEHRAVEPLELARAVVRQRHGHRRLDLRGNGVGPGVSRIGVGRRAGSPSRRSGRGLRGPI